MRVTYRICTQERGQKTKSVSLSLSAENISFTDEHIQQSIMRTFEDKVDVSLVIMDLWGETREKGSAGDKAKCRRVYGLAEFPSQGYVGSG